MKKLFSIVEFAKQVRTTKDTLIYYDKIDLFKPAQRNENGYRKYDSSQIRLFFLIQTYRDINLPINDIKLIINNEYDFNTYMSSHLKKIDELILQMQTVKFMIESRLKISDYLKSFQDNKLYVDKLFEFEYLKSDLPISENNFYEGINDLQKYILDDAIISNWIIGLRVNRNSKEAKMITFVKSKVKMVSNYKYAFIILSGEFDDIDYMLNHFNCMCQSEDIVVSSNIYLMQVKDEVIQSPYQDSKFIIFSKIIY